MATIVGARPLSTLQGLANGSFLTELNNSGVARNLIGIQTGTDQVTVGDTGAASTMVLQNGSTINVDCGDFNANAAINLIAGGSSLTGVSVTNSLFKALKGFFLGTTAVTGATYAAVSSDSVLLCRRVGTIGITLPANAQGMILAIVDAGGNAGANNITITPAAGTISGGATYVLNQNHAGIILVGDNNNTDWVVLAAYNGTAV